MPWWTHSHRLMGGSREAIFSRFDYEPDFPFISQMDQNDLDLFSKTYNQKEGLRFLVGRPYRRYQTPSSTWIYPWEFPQPIHQRCIDQTSARCHETVILPKKEEEKLNGIAGRNPPDRQSVSQCFDTFYQQCH